MLEIGEIKMDSIEVLQHMIVSLKNEEEPTYCGKYEYELWRECRDAKINVLEEAKDTIKEYCMK